MTLERRRALEAMQDRITIAEDLLERIGGLPGWYFDPQRDEEGNVIENTEGWPLYDIDSTHDEDTTRRGLLALELNKLVYDTCMKWIDGKK